MTDPLKLKSVTPSLAYKLFGFEAAVQAEFTRDSAQSQERGNAPNTYIIDARTINIVNENNVHIERQVGIDQSQFVQNGINAEKLGVNNSELKIERQDSPETQKYLGHGNSQQTSFDQLNNQMSFGEKARRGVDHYSALTADERTTQSPELQEAKRNAVQKVAERAWALHPGTEFRATASKRDTDQTHQSKVDTFRDNRDTERLNLALEKLGTEQKAEYDQRINLAQANGLDLSDRFCGDLATTIGKDLLPRDKVPEIDEIFRREEARQLALVQKEKPESRDSSEGVKDDVREKTNGRGNFDDVFKVKPAAQKPVEQSETKSQSQDGSQDKPATETKKKEDSDSLTNRERFDAAFKVGKSEVFDRDNENKGIQTGQVQTTARSQSRGIGR